MKRPLIGLVMTGNCGCGELKGYVFHAKNTCFFSAWRKSQCYNCLILQLPLSSAYHFVCHQGSTVAKENQGRKEAIDAISDRSTENASAGAMQSTESNLVDDSQTRYIGGRQRSDRDVGKPNS